MNGSGLVGNPSARDMVEKMGSRPINMTPVETMGVGPSNGTSPDSDGLDLEPVLCHDEKELVEILAPRTLNMDEEAMDPLRQYIFTNDTRAQLVDKLKKGRKAFSIWVIEGKKGKLRRIHSSSILRHNDNESLDKKTIVNMGGAKTESSSSEVDPGCQDYVPTTIE
ncbi:hypothetical protein Syun_008618 [Stephania yunnanensis]|uniref:Uncharacterized protein n=1 Tax=Stephania yunnanensis TaxID=152371 RepID=A0AAP0PPT8_9MAGN